jgi:hypothetical protein
MRSLAVVLLGTLLAVAPAAAQPPSPPPSPAQPGMPRDPGARTPKTGTAQLSGRVVAADTGRPIRRAMVRAAGAEVPEGRAVSTDADGRWQLTGLPKGRYFLHVSKGGYVNLTYGQRRPFDGGTGLDLADGATLKGLDISLPRAGVIAGVVTDEFGEPVSNVRVMALQRRYMAGQRRIVPVGPGDTTDDLGQYRLHSLTPGDYYVQAVGPPTGIGHSEDREGYAQTFYPGSPLPSEAQRLSLAEGQEVQSINFSLAISRVARISGTVVGSDGQPLSRGGVTLLEATPGAAPAMRMHGGPLLPDGSFTISNVPPGHYRLQVQHQEIVERMVVPGLPVDPATVTTLEMASVPMTVTGEDITGLAITTAPAARARGRIRFEGGNRPKAPPASVRVFAAPLEPFIQMFSGPGGVRDDWTFELTGLSDVRRLRVENLPQGWYVKSVTYEGHDITDAGMEFREGQVFNGIEVLLTERATELAGRVVDGSATPVDDYTVVAFAPEPDRWGFMTRYIRRARPDQGGGFALKGLPPGEYLVIALEYVEPGEEGDPEQLERWRAQATPVRLSEGDTKNITLRLVH